MIIEKENTEDDNKSNLFIDKSFEVEKMKKKGIECMQELGADLNDLR
jgi:hypothetical protein